uniref:ShKT domain-containing protein n=1 Tax=Steinernema glaseri TaxID=37863 RepID=A0A1I7YG96_9BILA
MFSNKFLFATFLASILVSKTIAQPPEDAAGGADEKPLRCQNKDDKKLLPSATSCPNELPDAACEKIFAADVTPEGVRDPNCDMAGMEEIALKCSKRCGICCENPAYKCNDDPIYATTFCPTQKANCASNVTAMRDMLAQYCPATCGLCMQGSCKNVMEGCDDTAMMCNDATFGTMWKQQCARTCKTCTASTKPGTNTECGDTADNCAQIASSFCNNQWYEQNHPGFIAKKCGKTCKLC